MPPDPSIAALAAALATLLGGLKPKSAAALEAAVMAARRPGVDGVLSIHFGDNTTNPPDLTWMQGEVEWTAKLRHR
jgi:hypothetical protein